jgi:ATP-dependent DNA helicase MPH1
LYGVLTSVPELSPAEIKKSPSERPAKLPTVDSPLSLQAMSPRKFSQNSTFPEIDIPSHSIHMPDKTRPDSHNTRTIEKQPESSSPVRARLPRRPFKEQALPDTRLDSSPKSSPPQRRLHRILSPSLVHPAKSKTQSAEAIVGQNPLLDLEAAHSGDEISEGSSSVSEEMNESDRQFLHELPETQVSPSYNQSLVYRESLMSQAPGNSKGPVFAAKPLRRGPFGRLVPNVKRNMISSSPQRADSLEDAYVVGTFVVDDDAELLYEDPSSDGLEG